MSDTYQIVFIQAGDGSSLAIKTVAEKIATASKTAPEKLLAQIQAAPFVYKKGLPKAKAEAISAALNRLGAQTEVSPDGTPLGSASDSGFAQAAASSGGFDFGGAPAEPAPSSSGGFDFGGAPAEPASSSGGFDFGGAASEPAAGSSGGFDFGGAPSSEGDEFAVEEPAKPAASSSGFDFSVESAVSTPAVVAPMSSVAVERNLDYAESSDTPPAPPPVKKPAATVTCPRCGAEVPNRPECSSCGVLMNKAGESGAHAAPRRPKGKGKKKAKASAKPVLIGVAVIVLGLIGAFVTGQFNPLRLRLDSGSNPILKQFGVTLTPPAGQLANAIVGDAAKGNEIVDGYVGLSRTIDDELNRLATLDSIPDFDGQARVLQGQVDTYLAHPANSLRDTVRAVIGPYYPVHGVAITVGDTSYMVRQASELPGAKNKNVELVLTDAEIRRRLDEARQRVQVQEQQRQSSERAQSVNVDFRETFEGALDGRWKSSPAASPSFNGGWLSLPGSAAGAPGAAHILIPEPLLDYSVRVAVSGDGADGAQGGLMVLDARGQFVAFTRARVRRADQVLVSTHVGPAGLQSRSGRDVQLRIDKEGNLYTFYQAALGSDRWDKLDQFRPLEGDAPRSVGIVVFGGASSYFFDEFNVTIRR